MRLPLAIRELQISTRFRQKSSVSNLDVSKRVLLQKHSGMKIFACLLSLWMFTGCHREADPQTVITPPEGIYTGTFQRGNGNVSQVEVTFSGDRYTGKVTGISSGGLYGIVVPVICRGQFKISQRTIDFQDECAYPANFDWTLILSREWQATSSGNRLILSRNEDRYVLSKQQ